MYVCLYVHVHKYIQSETTRPSQRRIFVSHNDTCNYSQTCRGGCTTVGSTTEIHLRVNRIKPINKGGTNKLFRCCEFHQNGLDEFLHLTQASFLRDVDRHTKVVRRQRA